MKLLTCKDGILQIVVFGLVFTTLSAINIFFSYGKIINGDVYLWAVMSELKPTFFIWEQNRYFNFITWLVSFVPGIEAKFTTHLIIYELFFAILCILTPKFINSISGSSFDIYKFSTIFLLVNFVIFKNSRFLAFNLWEGSPYVISIVLIMIGWLNLDRKKLLSYLCTIFLLGLATGINPTIALFILPLLLISGVFSNQLNKSFFFSVALALMSLMWLLLPAGESNVAIRFLSLYDYFEVYSRIFKNIIEQTNVVLLVILLMCSIALGTKQRSVFIFVISSLIYTFVAGLSGWIALNEYHFRYFYPVFYVLAILVTVVGSEFKYSISIIFFSVCVGLALMFQVSDYKFSTNVENNAMKNAQSAIDSRADFIVGNYWNVIPATYFSIKMGHKTLPVTYRSKSLHSEIETSLLADVVALCVDEAKVCEDYLETYAPAHWKSYTCGNGFTCYRNERK